MIKYISSPIREKIVELGSTDKEVIGAHVDPPKSTFSGY